MDKNFRDMCAIMAMQGIIARNTDGTGNVRSVVAMASTAFDVAEAMAAERQRREAAEPRAAAYAR